MTMYAEGFALKRYYQDISRTPLLSPDEEKDLARKAHRGDEKAKTKLVEANLRFVVKMAIPYSNQGLSLEDLIQEGNLGLLEGIERFDPDFGFRLTTYVSWWIRLAIQRAIEQKGQPIRLPANKIEQIRKVKTWIYHFELQNGRMPTRTEMARGLRMKAIVIEKLLNYEATFCSLDQTGDEDSPNLLQVLEDPNSHHPDQEITENEMNLQITKAMNVLSDKEKNIINHRFGLTDNMQQLSLRQIGRLFGLSAEGVRRIEEQALRKLRRPMVRSYVEGFV
jgi:RNA polymerase primary sigma factor